MSELPSQVLDAHGRLQRWEAFSRVEATITCDLAPNDGGGARGASKPPKRHDSFMTPDRPNCWLPACGCLFFGTMVRASALWFHSSCPKSNRTARGHSA